MERRSEAFLKVSNRLVRCWVMLEIWQFLCVAEVTRWQILSKWMYNVAVRRAQTKITVAKRLYFPRLA